MAEGIMTGRPQRRRRLWRLSTILAVLFCAAMLCAIFVVPNPVFIRTDAQADAGIVIAERAGRETAITVYADLGANVLAGFFGDRSGGVRITAIDIATGDTVWDERIHEINGTDGFLHDRRLIAANDRYVFLRTTFNVYIFSVDDGSFVATDEDIPLLEDATDPLSHLLHRAGTDDILFMGADREALRVLDLHTLEVHDADDETAATWSCVLDWTGHPYEEDVTTDAWVRTWGAEDVYLSAGSSLVGGFVRQEPLPDSCADAIWDEDVFPEPSAVDALYEELGIDGPHRLVVSTSGERDSVLEVREATTGTVLDRLSPVGEMTTAATGASGTFALTAERDLTGIAAAVGWDKRSSVVYVVNAAGQVHETILGRHGWFGLPW